MTLLRHQDLQKSYWPAQHNHNVTLSVLYLQDSLKRMRFTVWASVQVEAGDLWPLKNAYTGWDWEIKRTNRKCEERDRAAAVKDSDVMEHKWLAQLLSLFSFRVTIDLTTSSQLRVSIFVLMGLGDGCVCLCGSVWMGPIPRGETLSLIWAFGFVCERDIENALFQMGSNEFREMEL